MSGDWWCLLYRGTAVLLKLLQVARVCFLFISISFWRSCNFCHVLWRWPLTVPMETAFFGLIQTIFMREKTPSSETESLWDRQSIQSCVGVFIQLLTKTLSSSSMQQWLLCCTRYLSMVPAGYVIVSLWIVVKCHYIFKSMSTKYAELLIGLQKKLMAFSKENLMQMKQMYSKLPKKLIDAEVKKKS